MRREGECAVVRQGHLIVVVGTFVIGCAVLLLVVSCSGVRSGASKQAQGRSPEARSEEEDRCGETRRFDKDRAYLTNDVPGCPSGGLLSGTDGPDKLFGADGEDKIRGLGGEDAVNGGNGNDVIHAGPGDDDDTHAGFSEYGDDVYYGGDGDDWIGGGGFGEDVIYGGDGSDHILTFYDHQPDKLYCGKGKDYYAADKHDNVDSSCEVKMGSNA
jgi:hypothetical protein